MRWSHVHIVGAGLAGLAAALKLAGHTRVTVYEAGPSAGGRCRSYFDRELDCRLDNGNHLLLSGNRAAWSFLDQVGARDSMGGPDAPVFPFMDLASGERWTLRPNAGRVPWWIFDRKRAVPGVRLSEYAALVRLQRASTGATVEQSLRPGALRRRLLEPLAVSALNTPVAEGSARLMAAVMAQSLAQGGAACIPAFPKEGLSESFIDPAVQWLRERGAEVRTSARVGAIGTAAGVATTLDGTQLPFGEAVVLAAPAPVAAALLPGLVVPDRFEAIVNVHFRLDADRGETGFIGLVGGMAEWVFIKPGVVSTTISAANRLSSMPSEALAQQVWHEVSTVLARAEPMPQYRVVREKRATFAATPAQEQRRPGTRTALTNVMLAGDWTDTGLPATIEGAIRSGHTAAAALLPAAN